MSISVPYEQQVTPDTPQAPRLPSPSLNSEAYGTTVAASQAGIGETLKSASEQLANHAIERMQQQMEIDAYSKATEFRDQQNTLAYGDPSDPNAMVTRKINGVNKPVPAGYLNRMGEDAQGVHEEAYNNFVAGQKALIASGRTPYEQAILARLSNWDSRLYLDSSSAHEAKQMNIAADNKITSAQNSNIDLASRSGDPEFIGAKMDENAASQTLLANRHGINPLMEGKGSIDAAKTAVLKSAVTGQINGNNFQGAMNMFNALKDKIDPQSSLELNDYIGKQEKLYQANVKEQAAQTMVDNRMSAYQQLGALMSVGNYKTAQLFVGGFMKTDPTLGSGLQAVIDANGHFANKLGKSDVENKELLKGFDSFDKSQDKVGLTDAVNNYLKQRGNKLTTKEAAVIVQSMVDFSKVKANIKGGNVPNNPPDIENVAAIKSLIDNAMGDSHGKTVDALDMYNQERAKGTDARTAAQKAMWNNAIKTNRHLANIPKNGQVFHDKNGIRKILYPDGRIEAVGSKESNG